MKISIIIPALNEARAIRQTLAAVTLLENVAEVIVVDGGSRDATREIAHECGARVVSGSACGRGAQSHAGALVARGDVLWFLHADTAPPANADAALLAALEDKEIVGGNCRLRFDGERRAACFLTWLYPQLRRINLLYGDSGIFVRQEVYHQIGGFDSLPLFEDLDFVRRLRRRGRLVTLSVTITTSSHRFEYRSFTRTFARWTWLQILYWCGVSPHTLARRYPHIRAAEKDEAEQSRS